MTNQICGPRTHRASGPVDSRITDQQAPTPGRKGNPMNDVQPSISADDASSATADRSGSLLPEAPALAGGPQRIMHRTLGTALMLRNAMRQGNQRGLSQSTENAVLLTGAVAIALTVIGLVGNYVAMKLGELA